MGGIQKGQGLISFNLIDRPGGFRDKEVSDE